MTTAPKMTDAEARAVFDAALANETNPDRIAKVEMLREYFCNPDFRAAMTAEVARHNGIAPTINLDPPRPVPQSPVAGGRCPTCGGPHYGTTRQRCEHL